VYENICENEIYDISFLNENCPEDKADDIDYIFSLLDWDKNVDPHYKKSNFRPPVVHCEDDAHVEKWVAYGNDYIAARELTVYPGQTVTVSDDFAYGCIVVQGHGKFGVHDCEAAVMLRFGQASADEFFVSADAARKGVVIRNESQYEPLVILKHFPANDGTPDAEGKVNK
jgi:hypothetical protein